MVRIGEKTYRTILILYQKLRQHQSTHIDTLNTDKLFHKLHTDHKAIISHALFVKDCHNLKYSYRLNFVTYDDNVIVLNIIHYMIRH